MTKHSPLIRLSAAKRALRAAENACPHWDYESDGVGHECCYAVDDARRELRAAMRVCEMKP